MISTGVTGRGLDIRNVMHVIQYDLPMPAMGDGQPQDEYIHRIGMLLPSSPPSPADVFSGRTGRAGNQGLATSFYNEKDDHLAPFLAKILVENKWQVPDFLEEYKPADDVELDFNDDSGDEENEPADGSGPAADAWGAGDGDAATAPDEAWGAGTAEPAGQTNGFAQREDDWGTGNAAAASGDSW